MYNITNLDIKDAIENCNSAMTVKGQIIGYAFAYGGKNIENRNRKIKDGWYALHVGGSKSTNPKHTIIYAMLPNYNPNDLPPLSSIIGVFKIEGYVEQSQNPWFFGPVGSNVTKFIKFQNPILNLPGHQSITYSLDPIEKKLYKKNGRCDVRIKSKIIKELKRLIR